MIVDNSQLMTGDCYDSNEECPEGFQWGCCPDDTAEHPPGYPSVQQCTISEYAVGEYETYGRTCFKEINGRFWMGSEAKGQFIILNKDGTLYKRVSSPTGIPGILQPGTNRFGQYFTKILDKVVCWSTATMDTTDMESVLYVYDLDGNYLEYWSIPVGYNININGNVASSMLDSNDEFVIYGGYQVYNPANARQDTLFWFDYYGTCFKIEEFPGYDDCFSIRLIGNSLFCGNYFSKVEANLDYCGTVSIRNATTGAFIKRLDRQRTPGYQDHWGSALKLLTYKDGSQLMGVGMSYNEIGSNVDDETRTSMKLYDSSGNYVKTLSSPGDIQGDWDAGQPNFYYENGFHIFGDYMIVGGGYMNNPYSTDSNDSIGYVFLADLDGNIISEIGNYQPSAGKDHQLGFCVWMDKNYVYMFGGYSSVTTYVKICNINWVT